jgi:hypothetical protein
MTDSEISSVASQVAQRSICEAEVFTIARMARWGDIGIFTALAYIRACGMDFTDSRTMKRYDNYIRSIPNFEYLRRSPDWELKYRPMLLYWRKCYAVRADAQWPEWPPIRALLWRFTPLLLSRHA